jgi:hypothetical protein
VRISGIWRLESSEADEVIGRPLRVDRLGLEYIGVELYFAKSLDGP